MNFCFGHVFKTPVVCVHFLSLVALIFCITCSGHKLAYTASFARASLSGRAGETNCGCSRGKLSRIHPITFTE